jgi:hypothetical protein
MPSILGDASSLRRRKWRIEFVDMITQFLRTTFVGALLAMTAGGCTFTATEPMKYLAVDKSTGAQIDQVPLVVCYHASECATWGGEIIKTLSDCVDTQFYVQKSPVLINPPRHVALDTIVLPGSTWSSIARAIAPGYELEFETTPTPANSRVWTFHLVRLDERTIPLDAIRKIAYLRDEIGVFDVTKGVDLPARRKFCELVLAFYDTWQRRWHDAAKRQQYDARFSDDMMQRHLADAEFVVARLRKCLAEQ